MYNVTAQLNIHCHVCIPIHVSIVLLYNYESPIFLFLDVKVTESQKWRSHGYFSLFQAFILSILR